MVQTFADLEPRLRAVESLTWAGSVQEWEETRRLFADLRETLAVREERIDALEHTITATKACLLNGGWR